MIDPDVAVLLDNCTRQNELKYSLASLGHDEHHVARSQSSVSPTTSG